MRKELINQLSTANYATSAGNSLLIVLERKMQEPQKYHFFIKILSVTASGNKLVRGVNSVRLLDLFSGIGGFHLGFSQAGFKFDWVGFSEIDKYASAVYKYNFPKAKKLGDVKLIQPGDLPKIDIITFGSPCQDFSIASKRAGLKGTRSSLIWEAIRLITDLKPCVFLWENVKGTFSSNDGADFWAIIQAFTNIGSYRLEWELLNTRWFLPQNRERLYLVGYTGDRGGRSVFPIGEDGEANRSKRETRNAVSCIDASYYKGADGKRTMIAELKQIGNVDQKGHNSLWGRVYNTNGIATTLTDGGGMGAKTGLYQVDKLERNQDSYDFNSRVYSDKGIAKTLAGDGGNNDNKTGLYQVQPVLTPNRANKRQDGRRFKEDGEDMFTLTQQDQHGVKINKTSIRRLTPVECMRLQGFPDDWNEFGVFDGKKVAISDTQRYKQAGNAVTVNVVQAVAEKIWPLKC